MPKTNTRPRGPEADVAARIALEREARGLSAAELARRMTAHGCPLNQSAINKLEQGDPPRRITVDELVAFAQVFELQVEDLLIPAHAARDRAIERAYRDLFDAAQYIGVVSLAFQKQLKAINELVPPDEPQGEAIKTARAACDAALGLMTAAVSGLSDDVRLRLRKEPPVMNPEPKPETMGLTFRRSSQHEARGARVASVVKPNAQRNRTSRKQPPT